MRSIPCPVMCAAIPLVMKIALKLSERSNENLLGFADAIAKKLRNNPHFPDGDQWADDLDDAINNLESAKDALALQLRDAKGLRTDIATLLEELKQVINTTASLVDSVSKGDEKMIESAGMELRQTPAPVGKLPKVQRLTSAYTDAGEVLLDWDVIKGANSYAVQAKPLNSADSAFVNIAMVTASTVAINIAIDEEGLELRNDIGIDDEGVRLQRGTSYAFRVAAIGAAGRGPWSDPIERIAI